MNPRTAPAPPVGDAVSPAGGGQPRPSRLRRWIDRVRHAKTPRAAIVVGASGVCFAAANIVLARVLPTAEYAVYTLVNGMLNLTLAVALVGADGIVAREHLHPSVALRRRVAVTTVLTALVVATVGGLLYPIGLFEAATLMALITVAAAARFIGAYNQGRQRLGVALWLTQAYNFAMVASAGLAVAFGWQYAMQPLLALLAIETIVVATGWGRMARESEAAPVAGDFPWRAGLAMTGVVAAGEALIQLDRLIIPHTLPLADLATFGVLAAIAGSPYRVLEQSARFVLIPALRPATDATQRRRIVRHEAVVVGGVALAASVVILLLAHPVADLLTGGKYPLPAPLLWAAVVAGLVKVANGLTKGCVTALATPRELGRMTAAGAGAVLVAIAGGVLGARIGGLEGLVYGVGAGWLFEAVVAAAIVAPHLRRSPGAAA